MEITRSPIRAAYDLLIGFCIQSDEGKFGRNAGGGKSFGLNSTGKLDTFAFS